MIDKERKFIFIHIPKTGGTSVETFFNGSMQNHSCLKDYEHHLPKEEFDEYFKFTVVRNPFDIMVSSYTMICNRIKNKNKRAIETFGCDIFTFQEYVKNQAQKYVVGTESLITTNFSRTMFNSNQIDWIKNTEGEITIDYIIRFENLQKEFNIVCDKIGIKHQELPHENKSKHKHYTEYYDDETREIVAEKYAKDIEYFGYEFGE